MSLLRSIYHFFWAWTGHLVFGRPSKRLFVIGVTGTKGKTTMLEILNTLLEAGGKKVAMLSSVHTKIGDQEVENLSPNTMPGRWRIHKFLRQAVDAGCEYALVEVTSQGVTQHRHRFIAWDAALFLNLAPEHIEAHGSFEKYREAKVSFFRYLKHSPKQTRYFFINNDDPHAAHFIQAAERVSRHNIIKFSKDDVYKLVHEVQEAHKQDWLTADFNIENTAAAVAVARIRDISDETIRDALGSFSGLRGRLDIVRKRPFTVVVDYAHTPESLRAVCEHVRKEHRKKDRKLICVLGSAGGGRDRWKRPEMGKIVAGYCDTVVLTSEDPYDEDPVSIMHEIKSGITEASAQPQEIIEVIDRREAITKAMQLAEAGDAVLMTGKGSEPWFYLADGEKIPWNEREIAKEIADTTIHS